MSDPRPGAGEGPRIASAEAIRSVCPLDDDAVAAVREAFVRAARGDVRQPPVLSLDLPEVRGELDVKTAWVAGWDVFCLKASTGFFANPERGLPSASGLMIVLDAETGRPRAVLLDDGYLTELRTAAAGAVATDLLARTDARDLAVLGAGAQALWQARAVARVRPLRSVRVWARDRARARTAAERIAAATGVRADVAATAEDAVRNADVVVAATPSCTPLFAPDTVQAGTHVTAMGSDGAGKRELHPDLIARADRMVVDDAEQSRTLGELQPPAERDDAVLLGHVATGEAAGRTDPDTITVCDLTGLGVQDTAIARLALRRLAD